MALINHRAREIHFKIVYYGPGLGGKTTNLKILHDRLPPERRGKMISIATDHERTLFFDFLPLDLGQVNGFSTRFHLYTVPGQVYYRLSRRAVLQGVDGVVFVADSHPAREEANRESLADLGEHLGTLGLTPSQLARMPRVFQYNKRDLPEALPVERMHALLNPGGALEFESVASDGRGVNDTLKAVCKLVLARLTSEPATESTGPMPILVMRRPGRAQMAKMAADAAAAEAAAVSRSESAAVAAGTLPRPVPATPGSAPLDRSATSHLGASTTSVATAAALPAPAAASAPTVIAGTPRAAYTPRPVIAPPRPMQPRPIAAPAPAAMRPAVLHSAPAPTAPAVAAAAAPAPPAMPLPAVAAAPAPAPPAMPLPAVATAPTPAPAAATAPVPAPTRAPAAPTQRSLFRWPWPARISRHPATGQAPAAANAAPVPQGAPVAQAPASVAPVAATPAPPPVAQAPASVTPVAAPAAPQPVAPRMVWGRPPRPTARRGGLPLGGPRPIPPAFALPRPVRDASPLPANGAPATPGPDRPAADPRPPSPATEPA